MTETLSKKQQEVMSWVSNGWELVQTHGSAFSINGKHICNRDTVTVLEKKGLIKQTGEWTWGRTSDSY